MRTIKLLPCVVSVTMGLVCGTAKAQDVKPAGIFGWLGVGKAFEIEKGHLYWVGEFSGLFTSDGGAGVLHLSGWKCPGATDTDNNSKKNKGTGYCVFSDPNGDQAYARWQCEGDVPVCAGTFDFTGGTGKYSGISGHNSFTGHTQVMWPDGTLSGYSSINR